MERLVVSPRIRNKLAGKSPPVTECDIKQCFANLMGNYVEDTREEHRTDPPTKWFVSETDYGRKLKVIFVERGEGIYIKSAYDATVKIQDMYRKKQLLAK